MTFQIPIEEGLALRQERLENVRRVVVKVGSAVLTKGKGLNFTVIDNLAEELSYLCKSGREVILVSSGAVAAGQLAGQLTRVAVGRVLRRMTVSADRIASVKARASQSLLRHLSTVILRRRKCLANRRRRVGWPGLSRTMTRG